MSDFRFDDFETGGATGIDALFASESETTVKRTKKASKSQPIRVSSLGQLKGFVRVASDTLINKSTQDLWALKQEGENFFIERLFQDDGQPLKG